ncbi:hypothetical protein HN748_02160 [Candidatus Peregrinibacteria bacterium]|jgi:hypothetical protein|nr:hypothetical protein [Candidatus Peregrinibacteria bacterium]MBT7484256.1 hypothetical protein [Candidatus Peregrinibacteria bacterium]MBT7703012.1 hypothetical protein [Candidatus Peregrinibacteria bacterium]
MKERIIEKIIRKTILKSFFSLDLSSAQEEIASTAIVKKYAKAIRSAAFKAILIIPAIALLDIGIIVSVLIPTTMVVGGAWFAISLANVKKKFESFGRELTTSLFDAFISALLVLGLLTFFSLNTALLDFLTQSIRGNLYLEIISGLLGAYVMMSILYDLFSGALKYDINDAMLTGQAEAAEIYFKDSLSSLNITALSLREGKNLEVANYYLGKAFEYLSFEIKELSHSTPPSVLGKMEKRVSELLKNPQMPQKEADLISTSLIEDFMGLCINIGNSREDKEAFKSIKFEIKRIKKNHEPQHLVDTRFATILKDIAKLLVNRGEILFRKN